jgi:hypothetical protein
MPYYRRNVALFASTLLLAATPLLAVPQQGGHAPRTSPPVRSAVAAPAAVGSAKAFVAAGQGTSLVDLVTKFLLDFGAMSDGNG